MDIDGIRVEVHASDDNYGASEFESDEELEEEASDED